MRFKLLLIAIVASCSDFGPGPDNLGEKLSYQDMIFYLPDLEASRSCSRKNASYSFVRWCYIHLLDGSIKSEQRTELKSYHCTGENFML